MGISKSLQWAIKDFADSCPCRDLERLHLELSIVRDTRLFTGMYKLSSLSNVISIISLLSLHDILYFLNTNEVYTIIIVFIGNGSVIGLCNLRPTRHLQQLFLFKYTTCRVVALSKDLSPGWLWLDPNFFPSVRGPASSSRLAAPSVDFLFSLHSFWWVPTLCAHASTST